MGNLITLEEFKLAKGITKTDQDARIESLITNVSDIIQRYLDKYYLEDEQEIEETIDLDYLTDVIYLDNYPINSVTEVTSIDPSYYDSTVHFPASETEYGIDLARGKLYRLDGCNWPTGYAAVKVTYSYGGAAEAVPFALKQVAVDLVQYYKDEEFKDSRSMRGATINNNTGSGQGNTADTNFPPHIQRILDLIKNG